MIFWCHDQDVFCAAWYENRTLEEIINRTYFVPHGMKYVKQEKPGLILCRMKFVMQEKPELKIISYMN